MNRRSITEIANAWYASTDEVQRLGRDLLHGGMFDTDTMYDDYGKAERLLDYFDKPHHWDKAHAWWVANDWTDDPATWDRGRDTHWEITDA